MTKRNSKTVTLTAGQKAVATKGRFGLKLAGQRAVLTRLLAQKKGLRGNARKELLAQITARQAEIAKLTKSA